MNPNPLSTRSVRIFPVIYTSSISGVEPSRRFQLDRWHHLLVDLTSQHFCRRVTAAPHCLPTRLRATPRFTAADLPAIRGLQPRFVDGKTASPKLIFIQLCDRLL